MKRFFFYISFLLLLFSANVFGQEIKRIISPVDVRLNHISFQPQSWGSYVFSSLASANVMGIKYVEIHYRANILFQINKAEIGQYSANLFLQKHILSGTTNYRDFEIDSVLDPDIIEGRLELYDGEKYLIARPWLLAFKTGRVDMHLPGQIQVADSNLTARLILESYAYSDEKYNDYLGAVELIDFYYAFAEIVAELIENYDQNPLHRTLPVSRLLMAREEIRRVNKYAATYDFENKLNLLNFDPKDLRNLLAKSRRLERRAITLSNMKVKSVIKEVHEDKALFSKEYPAMSKNYIDRSGMHQPHIAAGYGQVSRLIPDDESKMLLSMADSVYSVFNHLAKESVAQNIYNGFVMLADSSLATGKNVACLDLLYNASIIEKWFDEVSESSDYLGLYVDALEGLMASYLKVATMAYRNGAVKMADRYYLKAKQVYNQHDEVIMGKSIATGAFLEFIDEQVAWSNKLIEEEKYFDAIRAIEKVNKVGEENNIAVVHIEFDSIYSAGHGGIFDGKMDSVLVLLDGNDLIEALEKMEEAKLYADENLESEVDDMQLMFTEPAKQIFDHYYKRGILLLKTPHPEDALEFLIKARSVRSEYLNENDPGLDSLINSAAVPVILKLVKKGEFDTWANRMENARALYEKAYELQINYEQLNNPEVVEAMSSFKISIDKRVCVNLANQCYTIEKKVQNRLTNKKYAEAGDFLEEALSIIALNPECEIKEDKLSILYHEYEEPISFSHRLRQAIEAYEKGALLNSIEIYISASEEFNNNAIEKYGISKPDLKQFVRSKKNPELVQTTATYFIDNENFTEAFIYLSILKDLQIESRDTKVLQQQIGKGMSQLDDKSGVDKKSKVDQLTGGDKWYRYFRTAY